MTASLLAEVCHKVQIDLTLQPISGESFDHATLNTEDGTCLDVSMNSFWGGRCEKSYADVKIFNPHAPTNHSSAPRAVYRCHGTPRSEHMKFGFVSWSMGSLLH